MSSEPETVLVTPRFTVQKHALPQDPTPLVRYSIQHPGAVAMVPLVDANHVCLIRNHRIAVDRTLIELPAGTLEPPEPVDQTARRELQEETGYRAGRWLPLGSLRMSPGILNEQVHLFVAQDLTPGPPAREAGEAIDNLVVPWDEAIAMVLRGEIEDAKSVAALLLWDRLRGQQ
jgi:ADP-ribose pyrophosphatase